MQTYGEKAALLPLGAGEVAAGCGCDGSDVGLGVGPDAGSAVCGPGELPSEHLPLSTTQGVRHLRHVRHVQPGSSLAESLVATNCPV